jgi:hypothetical protein
MVSLDMKEVEDGKTTEEREGEGRDTAATAPEALAASLWISVERRWEDEQRGGGRRLPPPHPLPPLTAWFFRKERHRPFFSQRGFFFPPPF